MSSKNDSLTDHYAPLLEGTYDCIDRIVLNAYIPMLMVPGGVRNWYRLMQGSDNDMSDATMMRFAGVLAGGHSLSVIKKAYRLSISRQESESMKKRRG